MAILDFLTGRKGLEKVRKAGDEYARSMYDPSQVNPMINRAHKLASEGINEDLLREQVLGEVYKQRPTVAGGISQGAQLAQSTELDLGRISALGEAETSIGLADEEAKMQGEDALAQAQTQKEQLKRQREAAIAENRMNIEAEASARKQKFLGGIINLASAGITGGGGGMLDFISKFRGESSPIDKKGASVIISKARNMARERLEEIRNPKPTPIDLI